MNDLERMIYTRGLENLYGNILLDDDKHALNRIEDLVYLTRELSEPQNSWQTVSAELTFVRRVYDLCWPETVLTVQVNEELTARQVPRGRVSGEICRKLFALKKMAAAVELELEEKRSGLHYCLRDGGVVLLRGEVTDV